MALVKQDQAKRLWDEQSGAGENFDPEHWIDEAYALTSDPRLLPSDPAMSHSDGSERFQIARQEIFKLAFPPQGGKLAKEEPRNIVIITANSEKESENWEEANDNEKLKSFRDDLSKAGQIRLKKEDVADLGGENKGYLPEGFQGSEVTSALHLYSRGMNFNDLAEHAESAKGLTQQERDYLLRTSYLMATFEEANLKEGLPEFETIKTASLAPQVSSISLEEKPVYSPQEFTIISDGKRLSPVIPKAPKNQDDAITSAINGRLQDTAFKAIEKGGEKIAKKAAAKVAGKVVEEKAVNLAVKTGVKAVLKTGVKTGIKAGIEAAGLATGPGAIVVFILTELADKLLTWAAKKFSQFTQWIKKHDQMAAGLAVGLLAAGAVFANPLFLLMGLGMLGLIAMFGTPESMMGAVSGAITVGVLLAIRGLLLVATGFLAAMIWMVVALVSVLFIFYLITVSGYVVPYWNSTTGDFMPGGPGTGSTENPYIGVEKVADPTDMENPGTVKYTVTITAKRGNLTNIQMTEECKGYKKNNFQLNCPKSTIQPLDSGLVIEQNKPYTFTYTTTYSGAFVDAMAVNTITITADSPTKPGVSSASTATVCIGDCPDDCPSIWPTSSGNITQGPFGSGSHSTLQAIDIGVDGAQVYATHRGTVSQVTSSSCYGRYIQIRGSCNGQNFTSNYYHLGSQSVSVGDIVKSGQVIGVSDNSGTCTTGPHLHYEFKGGLPMSSPYIPRNSEPPKCCNGGCGPDCTVSW